MQERLVFPQVGVPVDRRSFDYTMRVYSDERVRSLICCACACICLDTGGARSRIEFVTGGWLMELPEGSLKHNFSFDVFRDKYCRTGPLAFRGSNERCADFRDWQLHFSEEVISAAGHVGSKASRDVIELGASTPL